VGEKGLPFFKVGKEMQMEIDSFLKSIGGAFLHGYMMSIGNPYFYQQKRQSHFDPASPMKIKN